MLFFENSPTMYNYSYIDRQATSKFFVHYFSLGETLSFNQVGVGLNIDFNIFKSTSDAGSFTNNVSAYLGLYTLNSNTLTLINSGSGSISSSTSFTLSTNTSSINHNQVSWVSMVTSATSILGPGEYYFGIYVKQSISQSGATTTATTYTGGFYRKVGTLQLSDFGGGLYCGTSSTSGGVLLESFLTSDITKAHVNGPSCIIISA